MAGGQTRNCADEGRVHNRYCRTHADNIVQLNDVVGAHPDTSVARRHPDKPFFRRAVNVDIPAECISVLRFASSQPKNARDYGIATGRIWQDNLARPNSIFKHGPRRCIVTDLPRDLELAQRRAAAPQVIAQPELRRRNRISGHQGAAVQNGKLLLARADDNVMLRVRRNAGSEKESEKQEIIAASHARLNLKNFSAVSVVASAISSSKTPRAAASASATTRVCAGSQRFPRKGAGARYGQSVSTINFQSGISAATCRTATPFLKVTIPVNERRWWRSRTSFA